MASGGARLRLLGDIGGTNARFALQTGAGASEHPETLACEAYPELAEALKAYLAAQAPDASPETAALAVAAPISGDRVTFTNSPWSFSIEGLKRRLGLKRLTVINDFTAAALSVPRLGEEDLAQVGGGAPEPGTPVAVIGPGTGLGVSGLIPADSGWIPLATEGGHATLAPADDRESDVLAVVRRRFGHASAERLLSGQGLVNLCAALAETGAAALEREGVFPDTPEEVTRRALEGHSPLCAAALEMFCAMLGTVASNLALTLGARGGLYIAGGIVPKLGATFTDSPFRRRFEDKGRYAGYLAKIPTYVILGKAPALLGLASLPDHEGDDSQPS
jgi:glucokinase